VALTKSRPRAVTATVQASAMLNDAKELPSKVNAVKMKPKIVTDTVMSIRASNR